MCDNCRLSLPHLGERNFDPCKSYERRAVAAALAGPGPSVCLEGLDPLQMEMDQDKGHVSGA